jgi:probable F420-dependent oxidoreductase
MSDGLRTAIHLPQYGRASGADAITRAAQHAEARGFDSLWVSDHVVHPASQSYPSAHLFDPLLTLAYAAAVTTRVGLGTSVLVLPQHNPLALANSLASLDALSGGRLVVAAGVGWSEAEFDALGFSFHDRGKRADEIIDLLRACWRDDPVTFQGRYYRFSDIRVRPAPAHRIPIWIGGTSDAARRRAIEKGDGFHVIGMTPEEAAVAVAPVRAARPASSYVVSLRTGWDPQGMEHDRIRRERDAYEAAGIQLVVAAPWRDNLDDWLHSMDILADLVGVTPR